MESCIYTGIVRHRRLGPVLHHFSYRVFMMYLDLDELEQVFRKNRLWSARRPALAWFRRKDYLAPPLAPLDKPLKQAVYDQVENATGVRPDGPVRVLTNLRYFGYLINPITCYYVFDNSNVLQHIVAEVTNTPWGEATCYVIPCRTLPLRNQPSGEHTFPKQMHVSPFMPMDMDYHWRSSTPGERLNINLQNWQAGRQAFNASLSLQRREASQGNLNRILLRHPCMTAKTALGIYWQAIRLFVKKVPFVAHPRQQTIRRT
tara:strand:+ start:246405 stop:247184 length:780 start_codon:yes stop_codon:yes gene_type:complete